jgi:hypothetical protein
MCTKQEFMAHMSNKENKMNFCDRFFEKEKTPESEYAPTDEKLGQCNKLNLRDAQFSPSAVIIHECTHTDFAMTGERYVNLYTAQYFQSLESATTYSGIANMCIARMITLTVSRATIYFPLDY